ncbi:MAG: hypothetical protein AAB893_00215, partial [Patescibacteria group bacterium]
FPFRYANQLHQIFSKLISMESLPIINKTYEIYKDLVNVQGNLDKRWRYSLGISSENTVLDLLQMLIMAKNAPKRVIGTFVEVFR